MQPPALVVVRDEGIKVLDFDDNLNTKYEGSQQMRVRYENQSTYRSLLEFVKVRRSVQ